MLLEFHKLRKVILKNEKEFLRGITKRQKEVRESSINKHENVYTFIIARALVYPMKVLFITGF
ncbi:MAG: hypothetical protein M1427_03705 [Candidatus Thermoplasmatota archaeon]|nr:MAG: hypothetical protein AMDU5_GPLC00010G0104 [Thermoplasmatales archaeon Gpl]MCL4320334.1 hypothetical protein [Candidatus Thermoplasmatota archaeon]